MQDIRTVKLVVIGASGVGKTSLRGQYISGRFSNGYRATIGADFITKNVPHPDKPSEVVTLQIWDTAGQERFSSLSTAFFRGADAVLLMFDVNNLSTMDNLRKWWNDFCQTAPLADEDMEDYCCVVVGNKIDLKDQSSVTEAQALQFMHELVPVSGGDIDDEPVAASIYTVRPQIQSDFPSSSLSRSPPPILSSSPHTSSSSRQGPIAITTTTMSPSGLSYSPRHNLAKSRSRSSSRFYSGTMTTTHTSLTIYHTPSSSIFDSYQSARSSPEPEAMSSISPSSSIRPRRLTARSTDSGSSGSAATITPSLFARGSSSLAASASSITTPDEEEHRDSTSIPSPLSSPSPLPRGPKLFFTSAKTGEGVKDVFEYIAYRIVRKWEHDEDIEARRLHFRDTSDTSARDTIRLGLNSRTRARDNPWGKCCV